MNNNYFWTANQVTKLRKEFTDTSLAPSYFEKIFEKKWPAIRMKAGELELKRGRKGVKKTKTFYLPKDKIKQLYKSGVSVRKIAKLYDCSFPTISRLLKGLGVTVKSNVESVKRYELNESYFDSIDTAEKAYFLGFIAADGYVNNNYQQLSVTLHKADVEVLDNLKKALGYTGPVKQRLMSSNGHWATRVTLCIVNKHIVDSLNKLGIIQKKSLVLKFPEIDTTLHSHFIRGYFDGDGSIHEPDCFNMAGTPAFLSAAQAILIAKCELNKTKLDDYKETNKLCYNGKLQLKWIYDYLYKDSTVHLTRKKIKFEEVIK